MMNTAQKITGWPPKKRLTAARSSFETEALLRDCRVSTVCASARCPNLSECFSKGTATFLLLGDTCTGACGFCSVKKGEAAAPDPQEPWRIAEAVKRLGLKYAVITSVTRDDLEGGGSGEFAKTINAIKSLSPTTKVEVLAPDFNGQKSALETVLGGGPEVFGHDIETVRRLYPIARRGVSYDTSLDLFKVARRIRPSLLTKSALLAGLGESQEEIIDTMRDLANAGCDILMIGQYLRPSMANLPVVRYLSQEEFDRLRKIGEGMGFRHVSAGPFVRSSYRAEEVYNEVETSLRGREAAEAIPKVASEAKQSSDCFVGLRPPRNDDKEGR